MPLFGKTQVQKFKEKRDIKALLYLTLASKKFEESIDAFNALIDIVGLNAAINAGLNECFVIRELPLRYKSSFYDVKNRLDGVLLHLGPKAAGAILLASDINPGKGIAPDSIFEDVSRLLIEMLRTNPSHGLFDLLLNYMNDDTQSRKVRVLALAILGRTGDSRAIEPILKMRSDPVLEPNIDFALSRIRDSRVVDYFINRLEICDYGPSKEGRDFLVDLDKDWYVEIKETNDHEKNCYKDLAGPAVRAMIVNRERAIGLLNDVLNDSPGHMKLKRLHAIQALQYIPDSRATPYLIEALKEADYELRWHAARALSEIRDRSAVDALVNALDDADRNVRHEAARGLCMIKDQRAVEPLIAALKQEKDEGVRDYLARAIGSIYRSGHIDHGNKRLINANENMLVCTTSYTEREGGETYRAEIDHRLLDYLVSDQVC